MPPEPDVSLLTRFVLENPWPLGIVLIVIALVFAWRSMREGLVHRVRWAGLVALIGIAVLVTGFAVVTPGERGEMLVRQFSNLLVENDLTGAEAMLSADVTLAFGSPDNPGTDRDGIISAVDKFSEYRVQSNSITMLDGYSLPDGRAQVHIACVTDVGFGPIPSKWVFHLKQDAQGEWKISRITWVSINNRTPDPRLIW